MRRLVRLITYENLLHGFIGVAASMSVGDFGFLAATGGDSLQSEQKFADDPGDLYFPEWWGDE